METTHGGGPNGGVVNLELQYGSSPVVTVLPVMLLKGWVDE